MSSPHLPTRVDINTAQSTLTIVWDDGHNCTYPFPQLRAACPCVECRGGHANMGKVPEDLLALPPANVKGFQEPPKQLGHYALQFFWDDGHNTGIYTWEYLYQLCPKT